MFQKILVANRGEIAIRAFRAAFEVGGNKVEAKHHATEAGGRGPRTMAGERGDLPGGWPEPFRSQVLAGRTVRVGITDISATDEQALAGDSATRRATLNQLLSTPAIFWS